MLPNINPTLFPPFGLLTLPLFKAPTPTNLRLFTEQEQKALSLANWEPVDAATEWENAEGFLSKDSSGNFWFRDGMEDDQEFENLSDVLGYFRPIGPYWKA